MDKINLKKDSSDTNCSNRIDEINRKFVTTHPEQRNSKLPLEDSPVYDLVKQCKDNTFNLFNIKRKQKRKDYIVQGKTISPFLVANRYFTFCKLDVLNF